MKTILFIAIGLLFWSPVFGQTTSSGPTISGVVTDPTDGLVIGATVTLKSGDNELGHTKTDNHGRFTFTAILQRQCEIEVQRTGFRVSKVKVHAGTPDGPTMIIRLELATVESQVGVASGEPTVSDASSNQDSIRLSGGALSDLPILDEDYVTDLANLTDATTFGTNGQPIVSVDGMEVKQVAVSQEAVEEVHINEDPYSAEFWRPGKGRIDITTKSESDHFHGAAGFIFRDSALDARDPLAASRPPEQKRSYDLFLTGPIRRKKDASSLSFTRNEDDQQLFVYATGPSGLIQEGVPSPNRWTKGALRFIHEPSKRNRLSLQYDLYDYLVAHYGVGGVVLPEAGGNHSIRMNDLIFSDQSIISSNRVNQFQIRLGAYSIATRSFDQAPKIVVEGAFTGGGSQIDQSTKQFSLSLNDVFSWSRGRNQIKLGINIPTLGRNIITDQSNFGGTFFYSDLAEYILQRPFLLTWQAGSPQIRFNYGEIAGFAQDQIQLTSHLSLTAGLRYDWQSYFPSGRDLAPRVSLAYGIGQKSQALLRAGAGVFYDRTGILPIGDVLRYDGVRFFQYSVANPGASDGPPTGTTGTALPTNIVKLAPNARIPYSVYYSIGLEHQFLHHATISLIYRGSRGYHLFRSLDVNAPLPPAYRARPDPNLGIVRLIQSEGRQNNDGIDVTFRESIAKYFSVQAQYSLAWTSNDTGGITYFPSNQYDLAGEWARSDRDQRQRVSLLGTVHAKRWFTAGAVLFMHSGLPYTETIGSDIYNDGMDNARPPGVPRNSLQGAANTSLDVQLSHEFSLSSEKKGPTLSAAVEAFNLLNSTNVQTYVGVVGSPLFGRPVSTYPSRRLQTSLRFKF